MLAAVPTGSFSLSQRLLLLSQMCTHCRRTVHSAQCILSLAVSVLGWPITSSHWQSAFLQFSLLILFVNSCKVSGCKPLPASFREREISLCLNDSNDRIDLLLFGLLAAASTTAAHRRLTISLLPCFSFFLFFGFRFDPTLFSTILRVCTFCATYLSYMCDR